MTCPTRSKQRYHSQTVPPGSTDVSRAFRLLRLGLPSGLLTLAICLLPAGGSLAQTVKTNGDAAPGRTSATMADLSSGRGLGRIPTGTIVGDSQQDRWNTVVLLARPRLASGDVDAIPGMFRDIASSFVLTILATIEPQGDSDSAESRYRLTELGFGFSHDVDGQLKIVGSDDHQDVNVRLNMFEKRILANNERQLDTARLVARTSTLVVFDVPAIMVRDGRHEDFVTRHFVWIDARSGKISVLVWLMRQDERKGLVLVDEPMRLLRGGTREDRRIHVDSSKFILGGIPTERSFALESLPPGKPIFWTDAARRYAAATTYDAPTMQALTNALNEALRRGL